MFEFPWNKRTKELTQVAEAGPDLSVDGNEAGESRFPKLREISSRIGRKAKSGEQTEGDATDSEAASALDSEAASSSDASKADHRADYYPEVGGIRGFYRKYIHNYFGVCFATAFVVVLITEILARHSLFKGLGFLFGSPLVFLVNVMLVFATISLAMLFKRKLFVYTILTTVWMVLGIINWGILRSRMTPLTTADVAELRDGLSLLTTYFTVKQIILYAVIVVAVITFVVILFVKMPKNKEERHMGKSLLTVGLVWLLMAVSLIGGVKTGVMDTFFPNLAYGYRDNGFNYCFLATWLDKGMSRPSEYTPERISDIFTVEERNTTVPGRLTLTSDQKGKVPAKATKEYPNIVIVQLESFMDPLCLKGIEYNMDPMPNFRELSKKYSTGRIEVPAMGAGTANTEYEVLTGMSVRFYGAGETPYKTTIINETCEGLPYDLSAYGYKSHAIHNHRGAFYGRNKVYPNMGFDTFTCLEYMNGITKTPKNWAKDDVLPGCIFDALDSTRGKDFVFTISVQGHGKYPTEEVLRDPKVKVTAMPEDATEEQKWQWEYYANQLYDMDAFVGDLVKQTAKYDEPTIIVFYGDHMPAIDSISEETLKAGRNIFQTDYLIYSNFDMPRVEEDLYAYQISAELLDRLGIHNGTMFTFHQNHRKDKTYKEDFEALQYDMLFGKQYIYDGETPYLPTTMKMGIRDITIEEVVQVAGKYYIRGKNFTEYSKINLDGEILETEYLSPELLELKEEVDPEAVVRMRVSQVEKDKEILSTSE